MFPWILPIIKDDTEWLKDWVSMLIAINPGAKKIIKECPRTSPLSFPRAKDKTDKNNKLDTSGDRSVYCQTARNLLHSLSHKLLNPIQFMKPNLLTIIWYFLFNSTISNHI